MIGPTVNREDGTIPFTKILIVGNGAVHRGNEPLRRAIATFENYAKYSWISEKYKSSNPDISSYLAALAYVARNKRYQLLQFLMLEGTVKEPVRGIIDFHINGFNQIRDEIGKSFCLAAKNKEIKLRDYLPVLHYLNLQKDEQFGVISINWDELLLESSLFSQNLITLHGRASEPESMILPMESTIDDVVVDLFLRHTSLADDSMEMGLLKKAFRKNEIRKKHDDDHIRAMRWLSQAKHIVLWGVAFNSYDAELMSLIPKDDRNVSLCIINPDAKARDVAGTLLVGDPKKRIDYDPIRAEEITKRDIFI